MVYTPTATLSVVIPCYNEESRLSPLFSLIRANIERDWEWIFVDDGSTDNTNALVSEFIKLAPAKIRLVSIQPNSGKGRAVREGLLAAHGHLVGYVDADLAASPLEFATFVDDSQLRAGAELILGIRVKTHDDRVKRLLYRHLMGRAFQTYVSLITGLTVYDTQCGFKLMAGHRAHELAAKMQCDGFAFDVELIMLADRAGMHIREEMIPWEEKGDTKVRPWHIVHMAADIWRIRRRLTHDQRK